MTTVNSIFEIIKKNKSKLGFLFLAIPIVWGIYFVWRFGVNVLFWDEFEMVDIVVNNRLDFATLFSEHNEHRVPFLRLAYYLIARITGMNSKAIMYFNLVFPTVCIFLFYKYLKDTLGERFNYLYIFLFGLLIFSPIHIENFLWAWQIGFWLAWVFSVFSFYFVHLSFQKNNDRKKIDKYFIFSIVCAFIASFSVLQGLMSLIAVSLVLVLHLRTKLFYYARFWVWNLSALAIGLLYFVNHGTLESHQSLDQTGMLHYLVNYPIFFVEFILTHIGSAMSIDIESALLIGLVFSVISLVCVIAFIKNNSPASIFPFCLIFFGFLCAGAVAVGRIGFGGIYSAMSSRYAIYVLCIVFGVLIFLFNIKFYIKNYKNMEGWLVLKHIAITIAVFFLIATTRHLLPNIVHMPHVGTISMSQSEFVLSTIETQPDAALLRSLYFVADTAREHALMLEERDLNAFRNNRHLVPYVLFDESNRILAHYHFTYFDESCIIFEDDGVDPFIRVTSWAVDPIAGRLADSVYVNVNGTIYRAFYGLHRPDVSAHFDNRHFEFSGFERLIPVRLLEDGVNRVSVKVLLGDETRFFETHYISVVVEDGIATVVN